MKGQRFDSLAYALLDFERQKFESFNIGDHSHSNVYFDLASLTKPLTLAALYHRKADLFSSQDHLLLNHRGGLPAWGNLPCHGWREELLGQKVVSSETLYSDYSALRLMLELEQKSGKSLREMCDFYWDGELCHWRDLPPTATCPATGYRGGKAIVGEVNDPNAWNLGIFCSHAGLFATVEGLARSLLALDRETGFVEQMKKAFDGFEPAERFLHGWDTAQGPKSLAGQGCGKKTFGHLGFTGTSLWIDSEKGRGQILLTNGCHPWRYAREGLNVLRRELGTAGWAR